MRKDFLSESGPPGVRLWKKIRPSRVPLWFELEITARCNNNCRHCYINLPARDKEARKKELSLNRIKKIVDEAGNLGVLGCAITGGEPLLRKDFFDIYLYLKKKGFPVSVFTNATLVTKKHADLFKKYPPDDIEVTVYGVTQKIYERVTRARGSFKTFMKGLELLLKSNIRLRLKSMALRSNASELPEIGKFCREKVKDSFRFDPFLHLRFDNNSERNKEIKEERLSNEEIINMEKQDPERFQAMRNKCGIFIDTRPSRSACNHIFRCRPGIGSFAVSHDGLFKLCGSLSHPECVYDLKKGSLIAAYNKFVPKVLSMRSKNRAFLERCKVCPIKNLCMLCPATAHLETGKLDSPVEYFCGLAHSRAEALLNKS